MHHRLLISVALLAAVAVTACAAPQYVEDRDKKAEAFKECMNTLPAGPQSTVYNDWDEVVDSCKSYAYWQSRVCVNNCPEWEQQVTFKQEVKK